MTAPKSNVSTQPQRAARQGAATGASARLGGEQDKVQNRNEVVYVVAGKSLRITTAALIVAVLGIVIGGLGWLVRPGPTYFAVYPDGSIIPMQPLSEAVKSDTQIANWVSTAVTTALSMDFLNYRQQLGASEKFFTQEGFNEFIKALSDSGNVKAMTQNRYIVQATLTKSPTIIREGTVGGRYYWQIKVPVLIGYHSAKNTQNQNLNAIVTVFRVPTTKNQFGVAIQQLLLKTASN